ncbi:MAG: prolyl oligopeptidase family serine peptidase [Gemmatimonadota bacterium]
MTNWTTRVRKSWPDHSAVLVALIALGGASVPAGAQVAIDRWLVLGPTAVAAPFAGAGSDSAALGNWRVRTDETWPAAGTSVGMPGGTTLRWTPGDAGVGASSLVYAAAYVTSDNWQRVMVTLAPRATTGEARRLWIDGARVTAAPVALTRGTHLVVVERYVRAGNTGGALVATLKPETVGATLRVSLDPRHAPTWRELHAVKAVSTVALDPTGSKVALVLRARDAEADRTNSWLEVRDAASGKVLTELRSGSPASPVWSQDGRMLAIAVATDRADTPGRDIWLWDATTNSASRLLRAESIIRLVGWSPNGEWLYYLGQERAAVTPAPKPGAMMRLTEVWQRGDDARDKVHLFALNTRQGTRTTLVGDSAVSVAGAALSPDGKTIAFSRSVETPVARPWLRAELWTLDVATLAAQRLLDLTREAFGAPTTLAWSPDSRAVAFCGSAKELQRGTEDPTFSVYENELFATSIARPALVHLSAGFAPSVGAGLGCSQLIWNAKDGRVYAPVDAGARTMLARTKAPLTVTLQPTTLETLPLSSETMSAFDVAGTMIVAAAEGPTTPASVQRIDLATGRATPLSTPNAEALATLAMPSWKAWTFRNTRGEDIEAWYWLPPAFDSSAQHPMIVHYYGGTLPMKKEFEERLLWFASNGYVVLMMNPAGAPGYGQTFSNYHTNDWGFPAATDIIEGTQQFLATHRYVDAARVGNFGHSYGGFMTMHLLTRTSIFKTGIALAGISNIADYWGAGNSGYSYTDGTCPGCYPWNRKDIYVDRSPLFSADQIKAPLLLIHGTGDTNVVPTESEQMFTALRMLGREVELVRVQGENHGINSRPSVEEGRDAVMLDWFDKYLRDRPEAWVARWEK